MRVSLPHRLEHLAFRAAVTGLRVLPERWALALGAGAGWLAGSVLRVRRAVADANLARAFPGRDPRWRARVARASYANLGREAVATFLFAAQPPERVRARTAGFAGLDALVDAVRAGRGVVLLTGHLGSWELAGAAIAAHGLPLSAVSARQANRRFDADLVQSRAALGIRTIRRGNARREVLDALRAGRVVGFLADQDARARGLFVDFLGSRASTARGPALFALRAGAPLFLGTCLPDPDRPGRYRCEVEEVRWERSGDATEDVRRLTAAHARALAARVAQHPEHYFWQHRRWRTRPPEAPAAPTAPAPFRTPLPRAGV